ASSPRPTTRPESARERPTRSGSGRSCSHQARGFPLRRSPTTNRCPRGARPAPSLRPSPALGIILLILQAVRLAVELRQLFGRDQRLGVIQLVVLGQEEGIGFLLGLVGLLGLLLVRRLAVGLALGASLGRRLAALLPVVLPALDVDPQLPGHLGDVLLFLADLDDL